MTAAIEASHSEAALHFERLQLLLPQTTGLEHGRLVYNLYRSLQAKGLLAPDELDRLAELLSSSLTRDEVRSTIYFGYTAYALAQVRRIRGYRNDALEMLDYLKASLPWIQSDQHRRAVSALEIEERLLLSLDLGLPWAASQALSAYLSGSDQPPLTDNLVLLQARIATYRGRHDRALEILSALLASPDLPLSTKALATALHGASLIANESVELGVENITQALKSGLLSSNAVSNARLGAARALMSLGRLTEAKAWLEGIPDSLGSPTQDAYLAAVRLRLAYLDESSVASRKSLLESMRTHFNNFVAIWAIAPKSEAGIGFLAPYPRRVMIGGLVRAEMAAQPNAPKAATQIALQHILNAQACGMLARQLKAVAPSVQQLQAQLKASNGGLILLLPVDEETLIFVVDGSTLSLERAPSTATLRKTVAPAERALRLHEESGPVLRSQLSALTRSLLSEQTRKRMATWDTIRFDGLDHITGVPPALLVTDAKTYLGCAKAVLTWPSSVVGFALRERLDQQQTNPLENNLLALLAPTLDTQSTQDFERLTFTDQQLQELEILGEAGTTLHLKTGKAATFEALVQSTAPWLWVHAHGLIDRTRVRRPGLILAPSSDYPSRVFASHIEDAIEAPYGPSVALLAVCRAGEGKHRLGDDGGNPLASALIVAGAQSVILPSVEVHDVPARILARSFWQHMRSGKSPANALRLARIASRDAGKPPWEFGAFRLIGCNSTVPD